MSHLPTREDLFATFEQAHALGAYELARRWADVFRQPVPSANDGVFVPSTAATELDQVATMAALATWLRRWLPIHLHRALLAGASVEQVAAAVGSSPAEMTSMWLEWSSGQRHLARTIPTLPDHAAEYDQVGALLEAYFDVGSRTGGAER